MQQLRGFSKFSKKNSFDLREKHKVISNYNAIIEIKLIILLTKVFASHFRMKWKTKIHFLLSWKPPTECVCLFIW